MVEMFKKVFTTNPFLFPYAILHCTVKYLGYMLGRRLVHAPKWIIKICSSQDYFWNSEYSDQILPLKKG